MKKMLSHTAQYCSTAAKRIVAIAGKDGIKSWHVASVIIVMAVMMACQDAVKPVTPASSGGLSIGDGGLSLAQNTAGNGPGQCLFADARDADFINNMNDSSDLGCTAKDIAIAIGDITQYSINGGNFVALDSGSKIQCVPGDVIRAVTFAKLQNSANERYDVGLWINATPGGSALSGPSPQCTHYNLVVGQPGVAQLDGDQCGDINSTTATVNVPLDTLTLTCPGGGASTVSVHACAAWSNSTTGNNNNVCPKNPPGGAPGFRQGTTPLTTSKCKCNPLVLPIDVKGVLRIEKQTLPDGSSQSFTFTPNYNSGNTFNLTDGQTNDSPPLSAGTYTVAETVPTHWSLGTVACHITGTATTKTSTPITNGVSVNLGAGEDVTCVFTNTKAPNLTVNKVCAPTTDAGKFNLRIDGSTAGTGADAACGGTTGAVDVSIGSHTASETAGTATNLSNYTTAFSGDCASDGSVTLAAGDSKVCTITNTRKPTLTVNKVCNPTTDGGKFNLQIDASTAGTGANAACGGTTGAVVSTIGSHTVGETAGTSTSLTDYTTVISGDCAADGTVSLAAGQNKVCTITNTKKATLTINKVCVPTGDGGKFNLRDNASVIGTGANASCGGTTGAVVVATGVHTVSETAGTSTSLSAYSSVIGGDCATDGTVTINPGDNKVCTITNNRLPTIKVVKACVPTNDAGRFNLRIKGSDAITDQPCGGQTNAVIVAIGDGTAANTVGEQGNGSTALSSFTTTLSCSNNGNLMSGFPTSTLTPDGSGIIQNSLGTTLAAGDNVVCTYTNTRKPTLTVNKVCAPTNDGGKFNLRIDGSAPGTGANASCGGTTGQQVVTIGAHTVSETAGTSTDLANYTTVISGDCDASGNVTVAAGENKVCTITNTRLPRLTINKICAPTNDGGKFNLRNDGSNWGTGADASCGGGTGAVNTTIGGHTVSETAGTGTSLTNYTQVIGGDCASNGSITLAAGDNKVCTITNTRLPRLTINKVCVPTNDGGKFNLRNDGSNWGTGADASCGGGTGAVNSTIGGHTVSETGGTGTTLSDYASLIGGDCAADGTITLAAGDNKTCTITNTKRATLTVNKVCNPTNDGGKFNLRVDGVTAGTGANAACGGTTGAVVVTATAHTVSETAGTSTSLTDYSTVISGDCDASGNVTLAPGDNKTCTITNTRLPRLTINKICAPTNDGGKFNLRNDGANWGTGANASCGGGTGAVNTTIGGHTVSETAGTSTDLANYTSVIGGDCASNGAITLAAGDNKTCTITNTRLPRLTINKVCVPTNDGGKFNLQADGSNWGTGANVSCGGGTGTVNSTIGSHTVGETAGTATTLSNYDMTITGDCASDGSITLAAGDNKTCTITNKRLPNLTVVKTVIGDGTSFGFTGTGTGVTSPFTLTPASNASAQTTFSAIQPGVKTITEDASTYVLTDLACNNSSTIYDPNVTRTVSTTLNYGDNVTCTFTNEQPVGNTTRTQGFWATHNSISNAAWFGGDFGGNHFNGVADHMLCGREITTLTQLMGGFWSNIANKSGKGGKRSDLDKARMQLLQQLLAAELNGSAFGSVPSTISIADAEAAFCGTNIDAIKSAQTKLAAFNEAGDSGAFTPGASANAKEAKDTANLLFWDILPAG